MASSLASLLLLASVASVAVAVVVEMLVGTTASADELLFTTD